MNGIIKQLHLVGYHRFTSAQSLGFMLPLFSSGKETSEMFVQISDLSGKRIQKFSRVEDGVQFSRLHPTQSAYVGSPLTYVFVKPEGSAIYGELQQISGDLIELKERLSSYPEILIQIFDLLGQEKEGISARRSFLQVMKLAGEIDYCKSYVIADARNWVWKKLVERSTSEKVTRTLVRKLLNVSVAFTPDSRALEFRCRSADYWSDQLLASLAEECSRLFSPLLVELKKSEQNTPKVAEGDANFVQEAMLQYNRIGNQARRLAYLVETIFEKPQLAASLLATIKIDRAKIATGGIERIAKVVGSRRFTGDILDKHRVLQAVWTSLSYGGSYLKADFLMHLSHSKANNNLVADFIDSKINSSQSFILHHLKPHLSRKRPPLEMAHTSPPNQQQIKQTSEPTSPRQSPENPDQKK